MNVLIVGHVTMEFVESILVCLKELNLITIHKTAIYVNQVIYLLIDLAVKLQKIKMILM